MRNFGPRILRYSKIYYVCFGLLLIGTKWVPKIWTLDGGGREIFTFDFKFEFLMANFVFIFLYLYGLKQVLPTSTKTK